MPRGTSSMIRYELNGDCVQASVGGAGDCMCAALPTCRISHPPASRLSRRRLIATSKTRRTFCSTGASHDLTPPTPTCRLQLVPPGSLRSLCTVWLRALLSDRRTGASLSPAQPLLESTEAALVCPWPFHIEVTVFARALLTPRGPMPLAQAPHWRSAPHPCAVVALRWPCHPLACMPSLHRVQQPRPLAQASRAPCCTSERRP